MRSSNRVSKQRKSWKKRQFSWALRFNPVKQMTYSFFFFVWNSYAIMCRRDWQTIQNEPIMIISNCQFGVIKGKLKLVKPTADVRFTPNIFVLHKNMESKVFRYTYIVWIRRMIRWIFYQQTSMIILDFIWWAKWMKIDATDVFLKQFEYSCCARSTCSQILRWLFRLWRTESLNIYFMRSVMKTTMANRNNTGNTIRLPKEA